MNESISPVLTVPAGGEAVHHSTDVDLWGKESEGQGESESKIS